MKKLYILSLALASTISFTSCNKNPGGGGGGERITKEEFESALKNEGVQYLQHDCITSPVIPPVYSSKTESYNEVGDPISHTEISPTRYNYIQESQSDPNHYYEKFTIKNENDEYYTSSQRDERGARFDKKDTKVTKIKTPQYESAYAMIASCSEEMGIEPFLATYNDFTYKGGKYICDHTFIIPTVMSLPARFSITVKDKKISCLEVEYFATNSLSNFSATNGISNFNSNYTYDEVEVPIPDGWEDTLL